MYDRPRSFLKIEIEIKTSITSTFYNSSKTAGNSWGFDPKSLQIIKNWLC